MSTKKTNLIISGVIALMLLVPIKSYLQSSKDIQVKLELKQTKDMELQLFYTQNLETKFNEKDSVRAKIPAEKENFKTVIVDLKNVDKLDKLRVDLGAYPEKVFIKKLEILGEKEINIPMDKLISYPMNQIEGKTLDNGVLELESNLIDPYIVLDSKTINNFKGTTLSYPKAIGAFLLLFFGVYLIMGVIQKSKKND